MAEPPEDLDLLLEVVLVSHFTQELVRSEFAADGLDPYVFGLLVHVHERGTMTPSQLAEETRVTSTTPIRDQVQNLVERGLLSRRPNPEDARSYLLELTAKGRRFHERGSVAHQREEAARARAGRASLRGARRRRAASPRRSQCARPRLGEAAKHLRPAPLLRE